MVGCGIDIVLGGNLDFLIKREMRRNGFKEEIVNRVDILIEGIFVKGNEILFEVREEYEKLFEKFK